MTSLDFSEWPDEHDSHRCGSAPFVPDVSGQRQHSCGSYKAAFNQDGCNAYTPNYPDDLYIAKHGCAGMADCYDGKPPIGDIVKEGSCKPGAAKRPEAPKWPAGGYLVPSKIGPACVENFASGPNYNCFHVIIVLLIVWGLTKFVKR
jgi:hypothetical protein